MGNLKGRPLSPPRKRFAHHNGMVAVIGSLSATAGGAVSIVGARQAIEASMTSAVCTKAPPPTALPRAHRGPSARRALRPLVPTVVPYTGTLVIVLQVTSV